VTSPGWETRRPGLPELYVLQKQSLRGRRKWEGTSVRRKRRDKNVATDEDQLMKLPLARCAGHDCPGDLIAGGGPQHPALRLFF
jgi:hypothetical protein